MGGSIHLGCQGFDQLRGNGIGIGLYGEETDAIAGGGGLVGSGETAAGELRDDGADSDASLGS
jgi:hypothetical protein